ncbi:SMAD/FHA domain-containing protein [Tricharina praecox]|uniref:SMAD/FHA domain-containing protein n=1 Tax=Tricharina praecox TaxID=43433 RepID=UPI0022204268|nr:SMAD/FHA domain-containing protein [Tricharina praecox]KAI5855475.1 SMAD/FHA domain-containing protein [Tricharina praecox]
MGRSRSPRRERSRDRNRRREKGRSKDRERETGKERERERDGWRGNRDRERDKDRDRDQKPREHREHSKDRRRHTSQDRESSRAKEKSSSRRHSSKDRSSRAKSTSAPAAARGYSPPPLTPSGAAARLASGSPPADKERPNFSSTGLLAAAANTTATGAVLKYHEPSDARLPPPTPAYKLFVFKDAAIVDTIELNTRSCWLIGRDRAVADLPVDHPSCSKQHAVLQFRHVVKTDEFGERMAKVRLYLCDLESANGTLLGDVEVEGGRFVECREGDLIKFGTSTREYVVMLDRG